MAVGLVPPDLADILVTPSGNGAVSKTNRITGARELTSHEYVEWLKEKQRKKKEAAEEKERKRNERRHKKEEKEKALKRRKVEKQKAKKLKNARKVDASKHTTSVKGTKKRKIWTVVEMSSSSESSPPDPMCQRQLPAECREDSSSDDDDVLCGICHAREPLDCTGKSIFWVECEKCSLWVHSLCAFGNNVSCAEYLCQECSH